MLAIVESMKHWCHYLEGAKYPIQIKSDHKNLETFMTTKVLNCQQTRWAEFLASYDFVLVHIKGTKNPADGRSRRPYYMENVVLPIGSPDPTFSTPYAAARNPRNPRNPVESPLEPHWSAHQ